MEDYFSKIQELFIDERLKMANEKIKEYGKRHLESALQCSIDDNELINIIKGDLSLANECLELLGNMDDWVLCKQSEDIATFTKGKDSQFMMRAEMILKHPIFPVLALFSECQLLSEWVPILHGARVLGTPSKFRRVIQYFFKLPWPVNDRDMIVSAVGIPIPENNSALILLRSINAGNYLDISIPEAETVRMNLSVGCLNVNYISPNETQISLIARCDPKLALIPQSLVNYGTKHGIFYFMEAIKKKCDEYTGSEHEEIVNTHPEYYEEIRRRIHKIAGEL